MSHSECLWTVPTVCKSANSVQVCIMFCSTPAKLRCACPGREGLSLGGLPEGGCQCNTACASKGLRPGHHHVHLWDHRCSVLQALIMPPCAQGWNPCKCLQRPHTDRTKSQTPALTKAALEARQKHNWKPLKFLGSLLSFWDVCDVYI